MFLVSAAALMTTCCYVVALFNAWCFKDFQVSQTWDEGLGGDPWSIVKFYGWVAFAMFGFASLQLLVFRHWAARRVTTAYLKPGFTKHLASMQTCSTLESPEQSPRSPAAPTKAMTLSNPDTVDMARAKAAIAHCGAVANVGPGNSKIMV